MNNPLFYLRLTTVCLAWACSDPSNRIHAVNPSAEIRGTVRSGENGASLSGVSLALAPVNRSAVTDDLGQYEFADLPRGFTYLLTARREGFAELTATIDLTTVDVFLVVDLDLPPFDRIEPPVGDLRVWADAVGGFGLDEPSITFRLRLENVGSVVLRDLVITDSLDARADGYRLKPEDLSFVGGAFPGARLEIAEDGRSFIVEVDELAPTTSPVELLRLTIPTPPDAGVYCNRVRARASAGESPARHDDSSCLAGGI